MESQSETEELARPSGSYERTDNVRPGPGTVRESPKVCRHVDGTKVETMDKLKGHILNSLALATLLLLFVSLLIWYWLK